MEMFEIYKTNIICEICFGTMLVLLLVSSFIRRKKFLTSGPLLFLIVANLLLLLCQIAEWVLMIRSGFQSGDVPAYRDLKVVFYTLDYGFGFFSSFAYLVYVDVHVRNICRLNNREYIGSKYNWKKILPVCGLILTAVFGVLMGQNWFFYLQADGTEMMLPSVYLVMVGLTNLITVVTAIILFRHREVLKIDFWLLLFYKVSPLIFLIPDLIKGTCYSYIMRVLYTYILFIHVDLRSEQEMIERQVEAAVQEKELTSLRTEIMLSQIQPHFLYNTLTTISGLCYLENAERAKEVVDKFATYFRENLDSLGRDHYVSFDRELEHVRTYLWIEKVRFDDELNIEYRIGPTDFMLPSLTLQPLVENAVKHGIRNKDRGGTVTIGTEETKDEYRVIIEDDGAGFDPLIRKDDGKTHVGIENIRQRLEILSDGLLEIQSVAGEGTRVTVHLPKRKEK